VRTIEGAISEDSVTAATVFSVYRLLSRAAGPLVRGHLRHRAAGGREDLLRLGERFGHAGSVRPAGSLVWIHAASVGESVSALPIIERIRRDWPALTVLITTGTVTSAKLMTERLPLGVVHQYAPVDLPGAVRGFLDHWRPALGLVIESELWPNLLSQAKGQGVSLALVNGRMSASSFTGWRRFRPVAARLLGLFDLVLAQTEEDRARFQDLGARESRCLGNLKFAADALSADAGQLRDLQAVLGARPRWLTASTHPGEEDIVAAVHARLAPQHPGLLTLIAPRHPNRGPDIAARLRAAGHTVARRGAGETPMAATGIYVVDTMGEMGLWYRLSDIVFVGGSLVPSGGHNLIEPARLGCAVVSGPHTSNFRRMAEGMMGARAMRCVRDGDALAATIGELLEDSTARKQLATAAEAFAAAEAGVIDDIVAALAPLLDRAAQSGKVSG
jgi:3-deoxy-D-manno-octulosonic-acid transferase